MVADDYGLTQEQISAALQFASDMAFGVPDSLQ